MGKLREKCDYKDRCGRTGHYLHEGNWVRCPCLLMEMNRRKLGQMFCENPKKSTPLSRKLESDLRIEGPIASVRPHVASALLGAMSQGLTTMSMDAYRLIDIFLEKDDELANSAPARDADLLVMMLGFGDPRNRYLPELVMQMINNRQLSMKPTWMIMGLPFNRVSHRYSQELADVLQHFEQVKTSQQ